MDYISNGSPGKGMRGTSRAAKGFIQKRIRTRSFLVVSLNAPQLFLPRHRGDEEGIIMSLGDVNLRSWFDEATVEECEAIQSKDLTIQNHFLTSKHLTTLTGDEKEEKRSLCVQKIQKMYKLYLFSDPCSQISFENIYTILLGSIYLFCFGFKIQGRRNL